MFIIKKPILLFYAIPIFYLTVQADIIMSPYLQGVTDSSIWVLTECDNRNDISVQYGFTQSLGQTVTTTRIDSLADGKYMHKTRLTGLVPDTAYYYTVSEGQDSFGPFQFRTAVTRGNTFRFTWMADCREGTTAHKAIAQYLLDVQPHFSLYGGDLADGDPSSYDDYKDFFVDEELALSARVPFFNAVGDHEHWLTLTRGFTQAPALENPEEGYYSFDYGDLHVLVVNTVDWNPDIDFDAQYRFFESDLAASDAQWKVVISHAPAYAVCSYGDLVVDKGSTFMQRMTDGLFSTYGVDLVLSGHAHNYQHNVINGIDHLIIGSAGAPLCTPQDIEDYTVLSERNYCYAIANVSPDTLKLNVYRPNKTVIDSIVLTKTGPTIRQTAHRLHASREPALSIFGKKQIRYTVKGQTDRRLIPVQLSIFNLKGKRIKALIDSPMNAGQYEVTWDGSNRYGQQVANGVYLCLLKTGEENTIKKLFLVR